MKISYAPLWKTMKRKGISTYKLIKDYGFNTRTLNNMKHDESITMYTLGRLCEILSCTPNDIVEFISDNWIMKNTLNQEERKTSQKMHANFFDTCKYALDCGCYFEAYLKEYNAMESEKQR